MIHKPVLLDRAVELMDLRPGQVIVDGTVGAAGHARAFLAKVLPGGFLLGLDRDPQVAELAARELTSAGFARGTEFEVEVRRYSQFAQALAGRRISGPDRLFLDLGVCSMHLDEAERGFSLKRSGPLDMRMNPQEPGSRSAAEVVAEADESELVQIFENYGEERFSRRIARAVIQARRSAAIETTSQLREVVAAAIPRKAWPPKMDPATRVFQALRIEVNRELEELDRLLEQLPAAAESGFAAGIISFHSLEDRRVKDAFRKMAQGCTCPPEIPVCVCGRKPQFKVLTPKAVTGSDEEIARNPRARSAKLRVIQRL